MATLPAPEMATVLPGNVNAVLLQHGLGEVQQAVAGRLGAGQGTAERQALAGEHALIGVANALILAEKVADLAAAHADVTGRHVGVGADVAIQLCHEALAESHYFTIGLALRVKIRATLAAADRQAGQGILEDLLKAQELDDTQIHRGMETQAALVGADSGVELHAETTVHLHLAVVGQPTAHGT